MSEQVQKSTPLGDVTEDALSQAVYFIDAHKRTCSARFYKGTAHVWLGIDGSKICIDHKQAKALVCVLEMWIQTGSFYE